MMMKLQLKWASDYEYHRSRRNHEIEFFMKHFVFKM